MDIRCVVTGQNQAGKSVIMRQMPVQPITLSLLPGYQFHRLWGSDAIATLPCDGAAPPHPNYFPAKNGFRFGFFVIPPDQKLNLEQLGSAAAVEELQSKLPGMLEVLELDHPGMHTTDTVDFDVVVSGEAVLELDDGAEVILKAGDCVVQNGTRHAWHNRTSQDCVVAVTLIGAERSR